MSRDVRLLFVLSRFQNAFFHELAVLLIDEIEAVGGRAELITGGIIRPDADDVYVLLPPHEYMALEGDEWTHVPALLERTLFVTAEQPGSSFFHGNLAHAARAGGVFDFSPLSVRVYHQRGVRAHHLPFGYARSWDRVQRAPLERPISALFMGCASRRRLKILASMRPLLSEPDARLLISTNSKPNHEQSNNFVTGEAKRDLLGATKVLLNIHQSDEPYFEWLRVTEAAMCGAVVVTEPSVGTGIFEAGEHLLLATGESMGHVTAALLEDTALQERLRKAAYERVRAMPLAHSAEQLLDAAAALRQRPVPDRVPPPTRRTPLAHPPPDFEREDGHDDVGVLRQAARETRLDLIDLRRRLARLDRITTHGGPPPLVEMSAETPARRSRHATPPVTVITALYNHREFVTDALDSVCASTIEGVEVIVVDDGSTDGSGAVVADWLRRHPHVPGLLLSHPVNRGLPAARNAALAMVRAPLTFVLDADNEVLPHGFELLTRALDGDPSATFAYGLLERFDEYGPTSVIGHDGWDPAQLRYGNYIDAMALIRTAELRRLGGYTTDRRLYGWEDFDLWCRIAEEAGHAAHVQTIVGRYRASVTSMLAVSNVSHVPAWSALRERCPTIFARSPSLESVDPAAPLAARLRLRSTEKLSDLSAAGVHGRCGGSL